MNSLAYGHHEFKYHDRLVSKARLFSRVMDSDLFRFCSSGALLFSLVALSWLHMKELRKKLLLCEGLCKSHPECIEHNLAAAKKVRGIFMALETTVCGFWMYGMHRKTISVIVDCWDDLVVDLTLSANPEVRRLVSKFSGLL